MNSFTVRIFNAIEDNGKTPISICVELNRCFHFFSPLLRPISPILLILLLLFLFPQPSFGYFCIIFASASSNLLFCNLIPSHIRTHATGFNWVLCMCVCVCAKSPQMNGICVKDFLAKEESGISVKIRCD